MPDTTLRQRLRETLTEVEYNSTQPHMHNIRRKLKSHHIEAILDKIEPMVAEEIKQACDDAVGDRGILR